MPSLSRSISTFSDGSIQVTLPAPALATIRGDEELAEWNYQGRTNHPSWTQPYQCTPSVVRFFPAPREGSGDYRVNISPMRNAIIALNGGDMQKVDYLFNAGTALFNKKGEESGYPMQAYITMQGNQLKGETVDGWYVFETLKPTSNVAGMTHATHPQFVHQFDLVCWQAQNKETYHKPVKWGWHIYYFLVSNEGVGWMPSRYIKP